MALEKDSKCDNISFDYEAVQVMYIERVNDCLRTDKRERWTRSRVDDVINEVKAYKTMVKSGSSCLEVTIADKIVDVVDDEGVEILVFLNNDIQILPCEDCFDVFVDLHLKLSHAGFETMYEILQKHFYFSRLYLECFIETCNVCLKHKNLITNKNLKVSDFILSREQVTKASTSPTNRSIACSMFNLVVHIAFINIENISTKNEFNYLLIYNEKASGYILLRPLIYVTVEEIASELYKIFTDFGPPETIQTTHIALIKDAMNVLKETPIKYDCKVSAKELDDKILKAKVFTLTHLREWLQKTTSTNWAVASYVLQAYLNSKGDLKPIERLFGHRATLTKLYSSHGTESEDLDKENSNNSPTVITEDDTETNSCESIPFINEKVKSNNNSVVPKEEHDAANANCDNIVLHTEEDLGIFTDFKTEEDDQDESVSEFLTHTDSETADLLNNDDINATTVNSTRQSIETCHICKHLIMFNSHTCNKCQKSIHLFCGYRRSAGEKSFEQSYVLCADCAKLG